ncbi:MAG TPA: amino acid ABC transporter permease, partial [Thermoleophilia bacterium]|nr:amino acid ABC transporter permease [Thermoleophilia bacterium]
PETIRAIPIRRWGRWVGAAVVVYLMAALVYSFVKNPNVEWPVVWEYLFKPLTLRALLLTIELTFISMVIGGAGGVLLAVMRLSDNYVLSGIAWVYIWFFRGTPVYVQIIIWGALGVFYPDLIAGLPFTGVVLGSTETGPVVAHLIVPAILALGLNEAAYAAELVRAGIISVEAGQTEAALSLGMSPALTMRRVVLPQAMRVIVPTFGNETISMLKTTSLIAAIGGLELFGRLQTVYAQTFQIIPLLVVACIWYLFLTSVLTIGQGYIEAYFGRGFGQKEAEAAEKRAARRAARVHG